MDTLDGLTMHLAIVITIRTYTHGCVPDSAISCVNYVVCNIHVVHTHTLTDF